MRKGPPPSHGWRPTRTMMDEDDENAHGRATDAEGKFARAPGGGVGSGRRESFGSSFLDRFALTSRNSERMTAI